MYVLGRSLFLFHVARLGIICDVVSSLLLCSMLHPLVYTLGFSYLYVFHCSYVC
jgi:hypothetical protein